jgi:hypothetical protein
MRDRFRSDRWVCSHRNSRESEPSVGVRFHEGGTGILLGSGDLGRTRRLSDEVRPSRPCQVNLDTVLAHKLELAPYTRALKLALSLAVSVQTVATYLHFNLGTNSIMHNLFHTWPITYKMGKGALRSYHGWSSPCSYSDELPISHNLGWVLNDVRSKILEDVGPGFRSRRDNSAIESAHQKSMVTVSFGVDAIGLVKILLERTKRTPDSFKDQILQGS